MQKHAHDDAREYAHVHELTHAAVRAYANALDLDWVAFRALKQV